MTLDGTLRYHSAASGNFYDGERQAGRTTDMQKMQMRMAAAAPSDSLLPAGKTVDSFLWGTICGSLRRHPPDRRVSWFVDVFGAF